MSKAQYQIVIETADCLTIRDIGDQCMSVTNDAEAVVAELAPMLNGRRLEYFDSDGRLDRILVVNGVFAGFAPAGVP